MSVEFKMGLVSALLVLGFIVFLGVLSISYS